MIALTDEQQALVDLVTQQQPRIACLTGGPGTGKSTVIRSLIDALRHQGMATALAAPSGKAAARLTETTGRQACTIHRLLGLRPEAGQHQAIQTPVVVVDEMSMCDTLLFSALVRACFEGGGRVRTLLLVGDPDQLPPVGPGQPFKDLIAAEHVPTVRLTKVQRQALESGIVRAAYAIRDGEEPTWAPDFRLVPAPDAKDVPGAVWQVIRELELDPDHSQVLAPQKTHDAGIDSINRHIEQVRGADGPLLRERFRVGTKVLHTKNDYDLGVFNGELGTVLAAKPGPAGKPAFDELAVEISGEVKTYRGAQINMLTQAWAMTVHRAQGSEWRTVIFVAHRQHSFMLSRSLLYVAVTRARDRVVVVGEADAVAKAVRKVDDTRRRTLLQRWLGAERRPA
ncbi:MAG: AAA family ATPase [Planctomycetes bacterium]|nr:AAA family ATPase [Planctomycetota bacterium]